MRIEGWSGLDIKLNPHFLKRYPDLNYRTLLECILEQPWSLPTLDSNVYLPGMGTTRNNGSPTAFSCSLNGKPFEAFVKPIDSVLGQREFRNSLWARHHGILTPMVLACITDKDQTFLISHLIHDTLPLSAFNLDYRNTSQKTYSPKDLVTDFVRFIAGFHNKGLTHGDLHLGNIGFKYRNHKPPLKIIFDLETAYILDDVELSKKRHQRHIDSSLARKITIFESMAVNDLATFLAYLTDGKLPIAENNLLLHAQTTYEQTRDFLAGLPSSKNFKGMLESEYRRTLTSLQRIDRDYPLR